MVDVVAKAVPNTPSDHAFREARQTFIKIYPDSPLNGPLWDGL